MYGVSLLAYQIHLSLYSQNFLISAGNNPSFPNIKLFNHVISSFGVTLTINKAPFFSQVLTHMVLAITLLIRNHQRS